MRVLKILTSLIVVVAFGLVACEETETSDETYQKQVEAVMESFIAHRHDYNVGLEQMGEEVRSATNETEYRQALEKALAHLESAVLWFGQDRTEFALILPPEKFRDFHITMRSALEDFSAATESFITYYSKNLNMGIQDLELANRASEMLKRANENTQRATYMYMELIEEK